MTLKTKLQSQQKLLQGVISRLEQKLQDLGGDHDKLSMIKDASSGLYDEVDKLTKKAPAESITDLALNEINYAIEQGKELSVTDSFMQRIKPFVAAGDNPEHRDALLVLRQLQQGLGRLDSQLTSEIDNTNRNLREANGLDAAITLYLEGQEEVSSELLQRHQASLVGEWYDDEGNVDFEWVSQANLKPQFGITVE